MENEARESAVDFRIRLGNEKLVFPGDRLRPSVAWNDGFLADPPIPPTTIRYII